MKLLPVDRKWSEYPIGTKAHACTGGQWTRVQHGWKWGRLDGSGGVFPAPGGDAVGACIELPKDENTKAMTDAELGKLAEIPPLSELYSFYNQTNTGLFSGWLYDYFTQKLAALQKVSEAERRQRGLKSIDRICDTCGGEKDSEGRCAMCLQATLTAATARAEEAETRLFDQVEALRSMTGATETETPMFKARALLSELDRLRKEVERLREVIRGVLDSATPHPIEHPNMFQAFAAARAAIQGGQSVSDNNL